MNSIIRVSWLLALLLLGFGQAHAQATRTWVSGVGDDANPCSRTAPCKTFAGAISKTATSGEINVLDPGGFGALTITKSITIDGSGGSIAGVLVSGTNGIVVNTPAGSSVTLRNLDIDGLTTGLQGITSIGGGDLHVENCRIYGFVHNGINFTPATAGTNRLFVNQTKLLNNAEGGIFIAPSGSAIAIGAISNTLVQANARGIRVQDNSNVTISGSNISANTNNGVVVNATSTPLSVEINSSVIANNGQTGVSSGTFSSVFISGNQIYGNLVGVSGPITSLQNNTIQGNSNNGTPTSGSASQN